MVQRLALLFRPVREVLRDLFPLDVLLLPIRLDSEPKEVHLLLAVPLHVARLPVWVTGHYKMWV